MSLEAAVPLLATRRTKIIATIGPASSDETVIRELIASGVDVFRLNMSHGEHAAHAEAYARIRSAAEQACCYVAVLADLCGPKIRTGVFPGGRIELKTGTSVIVTTRDVPGEPGLIPSQYASLADDIRPGARILLADGIMELRADRIEGTEVHCTVVEGGMLGDRKGINLPDVEVTAPSLTDKDKADAAFALELGVDFLAQSFVRSPGDVHDLRSFLDGLGHDTPIIAKIERPEALDQADQILDIADAIMVARGDLGVELPPEQVPVAQRLLVDIARERHKPVIVATQMLESMIENPRPTRAEVADVSSTALSGADAIMLSAETAVGEYPTRAVEMMDRIARQAEGYLWREGAFGRFGDGDEPAPPIEFTDAVARSTALLSRDLRVRAIGVVTATGRSTTAVSSARPAAPILALTDDAKICRRMNLMWGVVPVEVIGKQLEDPIATLRVLAQRLDLAKPGDSILLVRGFAAEASANTPSVTLLSV